VAATLLSPLVFDPAFNKFTPLRDVELREQILDLASRAGIPGRRVYEVDRSEQTKKFNAYVSGFGSSQRIVLWDTTLKGMERDEILFVMGHEMGHYRLGHQWKQIAFDAGLSLTLFFLAGFTTRFALRRFGPWWGIRELHDIASLPLLFAVLTVLSSFAQPAVVGFSRGLEHEADVFGLEITRTNDAAARAFLKLGTQNRSDPEPSAFARDALRPSAARGAHPVRPRVPAVGAGPAEPVLPTGAVRARRLGNSRRRSSPAAYDLLAPSSAIRTADSPGRPRRRPSESRYSRQQSPSDRTPRSMSTPSIRIVGDAQPRSESGTPGADKSISSIRAVRPMEISTRCSSARASAA
jgi:Zn-dependent protease with chaperone function